MKEGDFAAAEKYNKLIQDFKNYEEEINLGHIVDDYLNGNQNLANRYNSRVQSKQNKNEKTLNFIRQRYQKIFNKLKKRQEIEIENLAKQWQDAHSSIITETQNSFDNVMRTAQIVASQGKYRKAITIRDKAMQEQSEFSNTLKIKSDNYYENRMKNMISRHQAEIDELLQRMNSELNEVDIKRRISEEEAFISFNSTNASHVVGITHKFKPERNMPKSLQMQTVHPIEPL
ncbi:hypothetical protein GPJ56_005970 [Histomonas meleagridis]|uniref:uncharacterized protein n=1 Tax=Histomonas meleagridis TaxID=135588 RepID=UPI00355A5F98|nr:hypothetical protein GPJ56_005970 [Histomonas meleagridis]KAH0799376.1 hypothetical protein GO595_007777 [Histomonas meleagridis]